MNSTELPDIVYKRTFIFRHHCSLVMSQGRTRYQADVISDMT